MKKMTLQLSQIDFVNLKNLIAMLEQQYRKVQKKLNGTKLIDYHFILIPMLQDRYLFRYTAEKLIGVPKRIFSLEIYQAAALYYFLQDTDQLPEGIIKLKEDLKYQLHDYFHTTEKTAFQEFYEENIMQDYGATYLELRDDYPEAYLHFKNIYEQKMASMGI